MTIASPPVRLLADGRAGEIRLDLDDPELLFHAPQTRPMDGQHDARSGIDVVLAAMKIAWPPRDGRIQRLTIGLPAHHAEAVSQDRVRAAITTYCDHQIALAAVGLRLLAKERRLMWKVGIAFLLLLLGLSLLVGQAGFLSPMVQTLLQGSLVIAGWVGLWRPLELTLYEWWPERFRLGLHNHLRQMPVGLVYF